MSMVVTAKAASAVNESDALSIDSTLINTKPVVIPPFECRWVKGLTTITDQSQWVHEVAEPLDPLCGCQKYVLWSLARFLRSRDAGVEYVLIGGKESS